MQDHNDLPEDFAARKAAAQERSRRNIITRQLAEAGLVVDRSAVKFMSQEEVARIVDHARKLRGKIEWQQRTSWEEIVPELTRWLLAHDSVVSHLNGVLANGSWFAERLSPLQKLWRHLYLIALDGASGFYVGKDSERGFENLVW